MILPLHMAALAGYLAAWAVQLRHFRSGGRARGGRAVPAATGGAVALHLGGLAAYGAVYGTMPLVGLGPASSSLAFLVALVVLGASLASETRPAGLLLLPVVLLLVGQAVAVGIEPAAPQTAFRGPWLVFHVASIFVGYAGLLLASAAAAMYLLQFRALKRKRFGSVFRFFPALESLERLNRAGLRLGFPALTTGLIAGWSWTLTFGGRGLALEDPEVVFGMVTWVAYLGAIAVRVAPEWRGERAAAVSTAAFALILATFLALRFTVSPSGFFL